MPTRLPPRLWLLVPVLAAGLLGGATVRRIERLDQVAALARWTSTAETEGSRRHLIVPERNEKSFEWIAQTEQMLARGELRVRRVDYDNAPQGREVRSASPYRWWLGAITVLIRTFTGLPLTAAVERAALLADPLLLALGLIAGTIFVARGFGRRAAGLFSLALVTLFPLSAGFLPGTPDDRGLAALLAAASVLALAAAVRASTQTPVRFALAGVVAGLALWVSPAVAVASLAGVIAAGLVARFSLLAGEIESLPWRAWALGGAVTVFGASLLEHFPDRLAGWRLDSVHPLYGLAWLGAGELLSRRLSRRPRDLALLALALGALLSVGLVMAATDSRGFLTRDLLWARLTSLPDSVTAASLTAWWSSRGANTALFATLAPLLFVGPALWLLMRSELRAGPRAALLLSLGPVLVAAGFGWTQLGWWTAFGGTALALLVTAAAADPRVPRWVWPALLALPVGLGAVAGFPAANTREPALTASEAQELIERHLAHWLASRSPEPGAVVYAPPHETATLGYYGRFRGLGSFAPENQAGFGSSLAVAAAKTMEEAEAMLRGREVRYLILPSWDPFFDNFAQLYLSKSFSHRTSLLATELRRWNLPTWLRPIPYQLPVGGAYDGQTVRVFEVVDEQSPAVALARLADYLVEMGEPEAATGVAEKLRRFPGDVSALAARIQVLNARADSAGAAQSLAMLQTRLATGADRYLPWDRRVSLAITLAQADQVDLAVAQTRRCLAEIDTPRLRSLSTGALYNLLQLARALQLTLPASTRTDALELLPPDLRAGF